jgi:hypothetical protein
MTRNIPVQTRKGDHQRRLCRHFFTDRVKTVPGQKMPGHLWPGEKMAIRPHILPLTGQ